MAANFVAVGILPAVESGRLARRNGFHSHHSRFEHSSGRQDAALYGRRDARRYRLFAGDVAW
jgi:hypothetical protein